MEALEHKLDVTVSRANQNTDHQGQLDTALSRINDFENSLYRYNFRTRGLPESITDIPATVQEFNLFLTFHCTG